MRTAGVELETPQPRHRVQQGRSGHLELLASALTSASAP
jgi:hypothetical protein